MGELFRRLHYLLNRRSFDDALQSDIEFHRDMAAREGRSNFGNGSASGSGPAKPMIERRALLRRPQNCHPDRSGGTCCYFDPSRSLARFRLQWMMMDGNCRALHCATPDFPSRLVSLAILVPLSLKRDDRAVVSGDAQLESGYAAVGMTIRGDGRVVTATIII